ncbi:thioesterase II family protein [Actinosynnema sp. CS-041913]|uniref:thioesterase II family protein n=1 Tax=Actinosynnema sp. CS-041913 TaxID=3239917 RepID=UPI003D8BD8E4
MQPTVLICLPFAGAGASFFGSWQSRLPEGVKVAAAQLAGREERFVEEPGTEVARAVDDVLPWVVEQVAGAGQVALFGHSMGAVLAYDLAHRLGEVAGVSLAKVFVSGSPGPWSARESRATGLDDDEFVARVQRFAGYSHPALEHPEMRELLLPVLRADVAMHENYRPASDKPLSVPITALRGRDDGLVSAEQVAQWSAATTGAFACVEFAGGHMYLSDDPDDLLRHLAAELGAS